MPSSAQIASAKRAANSRKNSCSLRCFYQCFLRRLVKLDWLARIDMRRLRLRARVESNKKGFMASGSERMHISARLDAAAHAVLLQEQRSLRHEFADVIQRDSSD